MDDYLLEKVIIVVVMVVTMLIMTLIMRHCQGKSMSPVFSNSSLLAHDHQ